MTKKFWQDWQKRANTTDVIVLFEYYNGTIHNGWSHQIEGIIQSVGFNGNHVKIHHQVWWAGLHGRHYENRITTVHRKTIKTVKFKF